MKIKRIVWFETSSIAWGGGPRFMLNACEALRNSGYEVSIVHFNCSTEIVERSTLPFITKTVSSEVQQRKNYDTGIGRIRRVIERALWLRRNLDKIQPDLVITTGQWESAIWLCVASLFKKINLKIFVYGSIFSFSNDNDISKFSSIFYRVFPNIYSDYADFGHIKKHLYDQLPLRVTLLNNIEALARRWAINRASAVFTLTDRVAREVEMMYGCEATPLPMALNSRDIPLDLECSMNSSNSYCLYFGRLIPSKRIDAAIDVFEKFAEHDAEFEMIIVGSGQDRERLENIARNSIYSERIKFRGYVSDADLLELIKGASFSLNLDIADFDLTTLESLALGCPVVVSKICDLRKEFYDINALVCEEEVLQTDVTQLRLMFDQCDRNSIVTLIQKHYLVEDKVKSLVA